MSNGLVEDTTFDHVVAVSDANEPLKSSGFFSGLFDGQGTLLGRDPEMQISNNFISSSSTNNNNDNPFVSNDQVNFVAEGSNNYEEFVVAQSANDFSQEVKIIASYCQVQSYYAKIRNNLAFGQATSCCGRQTACWRPASC